MMKTKEAFHQLIDKIENEEILKAYYELVRTLNLSETSKLWNSLTTSEKRELMISYEESFLPENLISHEQVKKQHKKWLER